MNKGIRTACLQPATDWARPKGQEVAQAVRLAKLTAKQLAVYLGLGSQGGRTVRRWISEESKIPYASWALLCSFAGLGEIWKTNPNGFS